MAVPAIMENVTTEDAFGPLDRPWTVEDLNEFADDVVQLDEPFPVRVRLTDLL